MIVFVRQWGIPLVAAAFLAANLALWVTYFVGGQLGYLPGMRVASLALCGLSLFVILPFGALKRLDWFGVTIVCLNVLILAAICLL